MNWAISVSLCEKLHCHNCKMHLKSSRQKWNQVEFQLCSLPQMKNQLIPFHLRDRKSTRLNSSHVRISYAVFCLKKKKNIYIDYTQRKIINNNIPSNKPQRFTPTTHCS